MDEIIETVGQIVAAQACKHPMTSDEIIAEISKVHSSLSIVDKRARAKSVTLESLVPAVVSLTQAFQKSEVLCMLCGKGMKALTRHLSVVHAMKPSDYRKIFGIPRDQPLTASDLSAHRRTIAISHGFADHLVKARAVRQEKLRIKRAAGKTRIAET